MTSDASIASANTTAGFAIGIVEKADRQGTPYFEVVRMDRRSRYQLQVSRQATSNTIGKGGEQPIGPLPTESNGIPIVVTDSINDTELHPRMLTAGSTGREVLRLGSLLLR